MVDSPSVRAWVVAVTLLLSLVSTPCWTQASRTLTGQVSAPGGAPAAGARVQVRCENGVPVDARADRTGRYRVDLGPGTAPCVVSVEARGFQPATRILERLDASGETSLDFDLEVPVVPLETMYVEVPRLSVAGATRWTPGSVSQTRPGLDARNHPRLGEGLEDWLSRAIGVSESAGPDGPGFSIAGQAPDQTRTTMDGAAMSGASIPQEAIRAVKALTSTYDVSRGQFTGGQLDVETLQGGNDWGATLRLRGLHPRLSYGEGPAGRGRATERLGIDAAGGGPLVPDRLFAFGGVSLQHTSSLPGTLDPDRADPNLGVSPAVMAQFFDVTRGLAPIADGERHALGSASGLLRLDAVLNPQHSATVRVNAHSLRREDAGSRLSVAGTGVGHSDTGGGLFLELASGGASVANQLNVLLSTRTRDWDASDPVPSGEVAAVTDGDDGAAGVVLRFAGTAFMPRDTRSRILEVRDAIVFTTPSRDHRLRLGGEWGYEDLSTSASVDYGRFHFNTLDDLASGQPARFSRSLSSRERDSRVQRIAFYTDDLWRTDRFDLSYGVRVERSWYSGSERPERAVEALFGRTSPVSPRAGTCSRGSDSAGAHGCRGTGRTGRVISRAELASSWEPCPSLRRARPCRKPGRPPRRT